MKDLFTKLLKDLSSEGVISEDKTGELQTMFEQKLSEYKEKIFAEAYKSAEESLDEEHTDLLNKVIDKIDEEHTELLDKVADKMKKDAEDMIQSLDEEHVELLKKVVTKYENEMNEDITTKLSDYLETYIEEFIPEDITVDVMRLKTLEKWFEEMKTVFAGTSANLDEEINEAFLDGMKQMDDKENQINDLMAENIELKKQAKRIEAKHLLEDKCKNLSPKLRSYLEARFQDSDLDEIEDKLEEAITAFEEDEEIIREELKQQSSSTVNPAKIMTEGVVDDRTQDDNANPLMNQYITRFKNSTRYNKK